ncbi:MAG TPA: hypothetical protein VFV86_06075 [Nitrososphaeraceae archaeon]|nr:hypothetical protein [Nitrososphaeraceae archaeon]
MTDYSFSIIIAAIEAICEIKLVSLSEVYCCNNEESKDHKRKYCIGSGKDQGILTVIIFP